MKISAPRLIMNPYEWLPSYGESKVSYHSEGVKLSINVQYEKKLDEAEGIIVFGRDVVFNSVKYFIRTPFPDTALFQFVGDSSELDLGSLTEFRESDMLDQHKKNLNFSFINSNLPHRHFCIQFLAENVAFHVVASEFSLSEEVLVR